MGHGAQIKDGYIEVDTDAWIEIVTGGPLPDLTDQLEEFEATLRRETALTLDSVALFIAARASADWQSDDFAEIQTENGGGTVNLSNDMIIRRYVDPTHGPVAMITTDYQYYSGQTTAYADSTHDASNWFSYDEVNIFCPDGHGWTYRGGELIDVEGNCRAIDDVFPTRDIITVNYADEEDDDIEDTIICPTCGQKCDVALPEA